MRAAAPLLCRLAAAVSLLFMGQARAATIHLLIAADTLDPKIGKNVETDRFAVEGVFQENVPEETRVLSLTTLTGADCNPGAILAAVGRLPVRPDDAVVIFYQGHGAYDVQVGQYLSFPRIGAHLTRAQLTAALKARGARLGVIATDCCNTLSMLKKKAPESFPMAAAPQAGVPQVSVLFRALFLDAAGFVDLTSSKRDEQSISYPATRTQQGFESYGGGLFTTAVTDVLRRESGNVLTWTEVAERTSRAVRDAFRKLKPDGLDNPDMPEAPQMTQTVVASVSVRAIRPTVPERGPEPPPPPFDPFETMPPSQWLGILGYDNGGDGVRVWATKPGSPAARLGFERGDVILKINDNTIRTARGFQETVARAPGAVSLTFRDVRTGQVRSAETDLANLGFRTPPYQNRPGDRTTFGASVAAAPGGVRIVAIAPGSPAAALELDPGDLITSVNGRPVADDPGYRAAIASAPDEFWLALVNVKNGQPLGVVATLDRRPASNFEPGPGPGPFPGGPNWTFGVHGFDNGGVGVYVWGTRPGSPAGRLGLERYDLILSLDGRPLRGVEDYRDAVSNSGGRGTLGFRDCRTGQVREVEVTFEPHPPPPLAPDNRSVFGAVAVTAVGGGVVVQSVVPGSAANLVGVDPGDVILSVNGVPVNTTDEYVRTVRTSPDEMTFLVRNVRNGQLLGMLVQLDR